MYTGQSEHRVTVNDGGIMHPSSFCNGLWNTPQDTALRHRILRRKPMEVALYVRVSTSRQQQQQTIDQQLSRDKSRRVVFKIRLQAPLHPGQRSLMAPPGYHQA